MQEKIDLTPTWQGVLPVLVALVSNGGPSGRAHAMKELVRMAQLADRYVEQQRKNEI